MESKQNWFWVVLAVIIVIAVFAISKSMNQPRFGPLVQQSTGSGTSSGQLVSGPGEQNTKSSCICSCVASSGTEEPKKAILPYTSSADCTGHNGETCEFKSSNGETATGKLGGCVGHHVIG